MISRRNLYGRNYDWSGSYAYHHGFYESEEVTKKGGSARTLSFNLDHISAFSRLKQSLLWKENTFQRRLITMLEMVVFAVTLVVAQTLSAVIVTAVMMKYVMSKKFIKKYTKMGMEVGQEIAEEMEDYF